MVKLLKIASTQQIYLRRWKKELVSKLYAISRCTALTVKQVNTYKYRLSLISMAFVMNGPA